MSEPWPFAVQLTCCGMDGGLYLTESWAEADAFRESYCSGPGVARSPTSSHLTDPGHKRTAIIVPHPGATEIKRVPCLGYIRVATGHAEGDATDNE